MEELKSVLKSSLSQNNELKTVLFKDQPAFDEAFNGVDEIYIDVTEIPIERSQNKNIQEKRYSGKKQHTLKWLRICGKNKRILFISAMYNGKTHDFSIFKEIFTNFSNLKVYVDLGFLGIKKKVKLNGCFYPPQRV